MGGKALKNTSTTRLSKADFDRVSTVVEAGLRQRFPQAQVAVIPAYFSKTDFGDLDVLVSAEGVQAQGGTDELKKLALEVFNATELFKNGNVLSFDYRATPLQTAPGFQVDVITMPEESFEFALNYFSFNDLGNLVGRTAHKQGCSFGHDGLWYYFRDGDYKFRELLLTRDFDLALRFLGYDPQRFHAGFEGLTDIFEYVAGSTFFNRSIFLLENRNYQSRVRDRKRKTYTEFLQWCENHPGLPAYTYPEDKAQWLPRLFEWFAPFKEAYAQAERDLQRQRLAKERFNGELVAQWSGLQDKELGGLMKRVRESFGSQEDFYAFVLASSTEELKAYVLQRLSERQATATDLHSP